MIMINNFCKLIFMLLITMLSFVIVQSQQNASAGLLQTTSNASYDIAIDASGLFVFPNSTDGMIAGSLDGLDLSVSQENKESNEPDGFDDYEGEAHDEMQTDSYGSTQTPEKISRDVLPIIREDTITESTNPLIVAELIDKLIEKGFSIVNGTEAENGQTNRFGASTDDHHADDNGLLAASKKVAYAENTENSVEKTIDALKTNYSSVPTFPEISESDIAVTLAEMNESQDDGADELDGYSDYEGEMQLQKAAQNVSQNTENNNTMRSAIGQSALSSEADTTYEDERKHNPSNSYQDSAGENAFDSHTETTLVSSNTISHDSTIIEGSTTGGSVIEDLNMADSSSVTGNPALPVLAGLILAANQF